MKDFATSEHPGVAAQLARLAALSLPQGRFGLETIHTLLARLGDPQRHLPPVFHVAGTNGKGSTCAFLVAMLEAAGYRVHSATKPHLVRYNERIRIAGRMIDDDTLAALLAEVLDAGADLAPSFFEVTTAALFLAFARHPADACVIEVGLGGRLDATNVLEAPAACSIASLGIDHEAFLLRPEAGVPPSPLARIAFEKAGIARPGAPLVTQSYPAEAEAEIIRIAATTGAHLAMRGRHWHADATPQGLDYRDAAGTLSLPLPALPGAHQADNAALATAILRHQSALPISPGAIATGIRAARWPARLQRLAPGPLTAPALAANPARTIWLDGGHNPDAGQALARHFATRPPVHLVIGMLANKDPAALLGPLAGHLLSVAIVPAPGHEAHSPASLAPHSALPARAFGDVALALAALPAEGDVLIAGSLYLAGEVLRLNGEAPE